ncbi:hypothetical protein POM88_044640 [Heracleum sosnowskyi]|uniref:Uncharacterized protein n=1 Tax=Heracleum sosnowskyi TaxID=360622 RepID=A0AAD8M455_9APIA|nr:hypothetical protein POM88_044640 [Heracleum sosnowskyi]
MGKALCDVWRWEVLCLDTIRARKDVVYACWKKPNFIKVLIEVMDFAFGVLDFLVKISLAMEDVAEFAKIGRYYAAESMLILDPETGEYNSDKTPSYGKDTLEDFFHGVLREGMAGQELGEQTIF